MRATRGRAEESKASIPIVGIAEEIYASRYEDIGSEVEKNDVGYQNYVVGRRQFRLCIIQASGTINCILLNEVTVVFGVSQTRIRLVLPLFIKKKDCQWRRSYLFASTRSLTSKKSCCLVHAAISFTFYK